MKRTITGLGAALLLFAVIGGCDSKSATETTLPAGSVSDPQFQTASEATAFAEQTDANMLDDMYDVIGNIDLANPAPNRNRPFARYASNPADSFVATYNSVTNYWTIYFSHVKPIDSSLWVYRDSIQFRHAGTPQQWPDSTIDEIRAGKALDVTFHGGAGAPELPVRNPNLNRSAASGTLTANRQWVITGQIPQEGDVVVNGSGNTVIHAQNVGKDSCNWDVTLASTISQLLVNIAASKLEGCPTGGTVQHTGTIAVVCTGANAGSFNDSWTQTITYNPNGLTITAQNSRASWTWSGACGERPGDNNHQGDPNDRNLEAFREGLGQVFDVSGDMAGFVLEATGYIGTQPRVTTARPRFSPARVTADSTSVTYHPLGKFWLVYLSATDSIKHQQVVIYDSIQFRHGDSVMQWPDSALTTEIRSRMNADFTLFEPGAVLASNGSIHGRHELSFRAAEGSLWGGEIVVNGPVHFDGNFSAAADSGSCAYDFEINGGYGRVKFDPVVLANGGCPTAGVVEFGGHFGLSCSGPRGSLALSDKWGVRLAFNPDGSANWRFANTNNVWEGTQPCQSGGTAKYFSAR